MKRNGGSNARCDTGRQRRASWMKGQSLTYSSHLSQQEVKTPKPETQAEHAIQFPSVHHALVSPGANI